MINMWNRGLFLPSIIAAQCVIPLCWAASDLPVTVIEAPQKETIQINLAEDEMILPPYLMRFEGGPKMNVTPAVKLPRTVKPKELLDYGDAFRLLPRMSFQIIGKEGFQFVGGGVFEGRLFGPLIPKNDIPYGFRIDRGWARVWVREPETGVRFETPNGRFVAREAEFWMHVQGGETELYLLSGSLTGPDGTTAGDGKYLQWKAEQKIPNAAKAWTREGLETKIKSVYPGLLKLAGRADDDWGDVADIYGDIRKKGWRKAARNAPVTK